MDLTERDILGESAGGQNNGLLCFKEGGLAGLVIRKPVAFEHFHADNSPILIRQEFHQLGAQHNFYTNLFGFRELLIDHFRTGLIDRSMRSFDRMAAMKIQFRVSAAQIGLGPLQSVFRVIGNGPGELRMIQVHSGSHHIFIQEIRRILYAVFLLQLRSRSAEVAAVDDGIAAVHRHFFKHHNVFCSAVLRFNGGRQSCKPAADDNHVIRFIPFLRQSIAGRIRRGRKQRHTAGHGRGYGRRTTCNF